MYAFRLCLCHCFVLFDFELQVEEFGVEENLVSYK
jgi:hypothetical protein